MQILPTQHNALLTILDGHRMAGKVEADYRIGVVWLYRNPDHDFHFYAEESREGYTVKMAPGLTRREETNETDYWEDKEQPLRGVTGWFQLWLAALEREDTAIETRGSGEEPPEWMTPELPARLTEISNQIQELRKEARDLRTIAGLLWQTGVPLNNSVKRCFDVLGFSATLTPPGETYDVLVELDSARRLLLEVTGVEGYITKKSHKIAQVLATQQEHQQEGDRVVIAVNEHRGKPPHSRQHLSVISPDALRILEGLRVNIVPTTTLYRLWQQSLQDAESARARVLEIHSLDGGVFT